MTRGSEYREPVDQKDIEDRKEWTEISSDGAASKQADGVNCELETLKTGNTDDEEEEEDGEKAEEKSADDGLSWEELRKELKNLFHIFCKCDPKENW